MPFATASLFTLTGADQLFPWFVDFIRNISGSPFLESHHVTYIVPFLIPPVISTAIEGNVTPLLVMGITGYVPSAIFWLAVKVAPR